MNRACFSKTQKSVNTSQCESVDLQEQREKRSNLRFVRSNIVRFSRLFLYMVPFLLFSCENESLETLNPSIYFANNIDYYVIDEEAPLTTDTIIKGSMSAEGFLAQVRMGDFSLNQDSIGTLVTRYMIRYPVTFSGSTQPFNVDFSCMDANNVSTSKTFHFLKSKPIDTYVVTLGAQLNSNYGFYFSFSDCKVHSLSEFKQLKDTDEGFCFGFNKVKEEFLFLSPTELKNKSIVDLKGSKVTSFCEIVAVNNQPFNKASFDQIRNDAFMRNLNGADYRTFSYSIIGADRFFLVKSESGLRGVIYVQNAKKGIAGSVDLVIKLQKQ